MFEMKVFRELSDTLQRFSDSLRALCPQEKAPQRKRKKRIAKKIAARGGYLHYGPWS